MKDNVRTLPVRRRSVPPQQVRKPPAPRHLEPAEKLMWRDIISGFRFDDPASLALLRSALEAHMRARRCRVVIDRDGETVLDRFEQTRAHPLLAAERDARAAFLAAMRALNLDLGRAP
jgi:hypothetical protein